MNKKVLSIIFMLIILLLAGCGPGQTSEHPTILGTLTYSSKPIDGATVSLESYRDEACSILAESSELSDEEEQELDACTSEYATTKSNAEGEYKFSDVEPGWYKLLFNWDLDDKPDSQMAFEFLNGFLVFYYETDSTSNKYSGLAQYSIFYFTGEEDIIIDF